MADVTYRIRHTDGRWLETCQLTAWEDKRWTVVPGWHEEKAITFPTREEAMCLWGALTQRGFPVEVVECP